MVEVRASEKSGRVIYFVCLFVYVFFCTAAGLITSTSSVLADDCVEGKSSHPAKFKSIKFDIDNDGCLDYIEAYGFQFTSEISVNYGYATGSEAKPPVQYVLGDVGYPETRTFLQLSQDGTIDFCREIGNRGQRPEDHWISCNKLSSTALSDAYKLPIKDLGYAGSGSWRTDTQNARYCRLVGNPPNIEKKCAVLKGKNLVQEYETHSPLISPANLGAISDKTLLIALKNGDGSAMRNSLRQAVPSWLQCQQQSQTMGICNQGMSGLTQFTNGFLYQFDVQNQRASLNVVLIAGQNADHALMKSAASAILARYGMSGQELERCVGNFRWGGIEGNQPFVFQKKDAGMSLSCRSGYLSYKQYQINFNVERDKTF